MSDYQVWAEKYRPRSLKDVINQTHVIERLKAFVKDKNVPHCLLAGPPGTGKTASSLALAHDLFGEHWRGNVLETNASDERGIGIIRGKIKDFARTKTIGDIPLKVIILDEADALTSDAQQALRRTMENFSNTTRFFLICVSPDTRVILEEELETTIEELKGIKNNVLSLDLTNNSIQSDQNIAFIELDPKSLGKKTLSIKTSTGRELKLTEDHPLLTRGGWGLAGDLNRGDLVAVFPHLENTPIENNNEIIVDKNDFNDFIEKYEIRLQNKKPVKEAKRFYELTTKGKNFIRNTVLKLFNEYVLTDRGLTPREEDIIKIIRDSPYISRSEIQNKIKLSRPRVVQLLKSLEKKCHIERIIDIQNSKIHYFVAIKEKWFVLRNKMDITRLIKENFGLVISYSEIKRIIEGKPIKGTSEFVIKELEGRGLLPLTYNNPKIGTVARLAGALLGDGHLTSNERTLIFTSNEEMLREIQNDIYKLGFNPRGIRKNAIKNKIAGDRVISGTTTEFRVNSISLWLLFSYLGVPTGDKVVASYEIPIWIKKGTKFVKREFLRALFDCESTTPVIKKHNFEAISIVQHKVKDKLQNGRLFMQQIKDLLDNFGVSSYPIRIRKVRSRKDGCEVFATILSIKASDNNLLNFFKNVGFFYEPKKKTVGRIAQEYLRYKTCLIEKRKNLAQKILVAVNNGKGIWKISKEFECSPDFVYDRIKGKKIGTSYKNLLSFEEWKERFWIKNSELVWNEIEEITSITLNKVVDIKTKDFHTFVSNGIISHNCNFSSKILEPIQSRCSVFRFKRLVEDDIKKYIERVVEGEKLKITDDAIKAVMYLSEGDLRRVSNLLQAAASLKEKISADIIYDVSNQAKPDDVKDMINLVLNGKFANARKKLHDMLLIQGLSGEDIIKEIHKQIYNLDVAEEDKIKLIELSGEYDFRISEGGSELIQLEALLAQFMLVKKK